MKSHPATRPPSVVTPARASLLVLVMVFAGLHQTRADRQPENLLIRRADGAPRLELAEPPVAPVAGSTYRLWIESSSDLTHWKSAGELTPGPDGRPQTPAVSSEPAGFFRLRPEVTLSAGPTDGSDTLGYNRVFEEERRRIGWLTPAEFAEQSRAGTTYLESLRFDPRTAKYWDAFNADPAVLNRGKTPVSPGYRSVDFRLDAEELSRFLTNGFVVSERLGAPNAREFMAGNSTFAGVFYRVFFNDLPVFVSADSALHAWHFSYQRMLAEMEETELFPRLRDILDAMAQTLGQASPTVANGPLKDSLRDADYFLAVARSLLLGKRAEPVLGPHPDFDPTLQAIRAKQVIHGLRMFGGSRDADFSQYEVRGYYDRSVELSNYFQAYQWISRADLRIFDTDDVTQSRRELATAFVLTTLLRESGQAEAWRTLDRVVRLFVGRADALNIPQLEPMLASAGLVSLSSVHDLAQIAALQAAILKGDLGRQQIPGDVYFSPLGPEQVQLPRAFVFGGQRFIADGWAMAQVTFDRMLWREDIPGLTLDKKILRREPCVLDVAYSVFGNRAAGPELARLMLQPQRPGNFRDGYPYAHHLQALASTFDRLGVASWEDSLYMRWLGALRTLSEPTTAENFPQAMRTRAWAMKSLNTQMASYSELKHDTLLYGKQPYANNFVCEYPAGFVEPVTAFWRAMRTLAETAATALSAKDFSAQGEATATPPGATWSRSVVRPVRNYARIRFCQYFAAQMARLEAMAAKELQQQPFSAAEVQFLRGLMNAQGGCGLSFNGWYPSLYYADYSVFTGSSDPGQFAVEGEDSGCNRIDSLVADIFTAAPDILDPLGGVVHVATGNIDLLLIAVDNGPDRAMYAGPVLSHYEFLEPGPVLHRLNNSEWRTRLGGHPARPEWTRSHLVPRP